MGRLMRRKEAGCQGGWHPRPRDPGRLRLVVGVLVLVGFWAWPRGCTSLRYGVMDPLDTIHSHHYHTGAEAAADAGGASKSVWPTASSRRAQSHALHVFVTPFEPGVDPGRTALSSDEVSAGEHSNSGRSRWRSRLPLWQSLDHWDIRQDLCTAGVPYADVHWYSAADAHCSSAIAAG